MRFVVMLLSTHPQAPQAKGKSQAEHLAVKRRSQSGRSTMARLLHTPHRSAAHHHPPRTCRAGSCRRGQRP